MGPLPKNPCPPVLSLLLDTPLRKLLIDREKFLREMGIKEGDTVLEVGCGPGFFTEALSAVVGGSGRVCAQDIEEAVLRRVQKKLASLGRRNVVPLLCLSSSLALAGSSCDVVLCANVIEEIYKEGELSGTAVEIDRVLVPGGTLVIKEHRLGGTAHMIEECEGLFTGLGYKKVSEKRTLLSYHSRFVKG